MPLPMQAQEESLYFRVQGGLAKYFFASKAKKRKKGVCLFFLCLAWPYVFGPRAI